MEYSDLLHNEIEFYAHKDDSFYCSSDKALALLNEITRLQSEARWIPTSERLPEIGEVVQWTHPLFSRVREGYITESGELKVWGNGYCVLDNFKWRSLPTPPTEG